MVMMVEARISGRLYLTGSEADVRQAAAAAEMALS
jgi:hypothetical protein